VVNNVARGGSRSDDDNGSSGKSKKSSSPKGKKKKSGKEPSASARSKGRGKGNPGASRAETGTTNPLLEEILGHEDLYDVLGVANTASDREIQKAYRKRCVQTHPDKTGGDRRAFDKVAEAYEILSDTSKRQIYNRYGKAGLDPSAGAGASPFGSGGGAAADVFKSMFQQAQQQRAQQARRNQTLRYQLEVTLEDLYFGRTKGVAVTPPHNRYGHQQRQRQRKEVEVHIQKGSLSGQSIVMSGEVDFNDDNSPPGDLVFILTQAPHATFTRKGHDLAMELTISLEEALCGMGRTVRHLDGSELWIESATSQQQASNGKTDKDSDGDVDVDDATSSPARTPITIRTGDVQVLKGRGMPKRNKNGEFGDLYVQYRVEMPQNSKGSSARAAQGQSLTNAEYQELSRLLSKLESGSPSARSDIATRRKKFRDRRNNHHTTKADGEGQEQRIPPKIHALKEARPSDFGTASGRIDLEENDGGFHEDHGDDYHPFASGFFGGPQGFGSSRGFSQFHFGGPGGGGNPFGAGGSPFGGPGGDGDDGNVQCQQM